MPATNFTSRSRTLMPLALLAAVAMTCLQGAAFAGAVPMETNGRTITIDTSGMNLSNPAEVAQLNDRIQRAARSVCTPANGRDLEAMANRAACQRVALGNATAKRDVLVARAEAEQLAQRTQTQPGAN
jgi:UrcA family protein